MIEVRRTLFVNFHGNKGSLASIRESSNIYDTTYEISGLVYTFIEFGIDHVATTSGGAERTCRRAGGDAVENAKGAAEGAGNEPEIATRSAGERGTKRGSRRTDSNPRETLPQCSTGVH